MRHSYSIRPIGSVTRSGEKTYIEVDKEHRPGLIGLEDFSHLEVTWWCHACDAEGYRRTLQFNPPFAAPRLGVFASRAPIRPNPLATSVVPIVALDVERGCLEIGSIDAYTDTPVIDIKPYMPMYSRVRNPQTPAWAAKWPEWMPDEGIELEEIPKG